MLKNSLKSLPETPGIYIFWSKKIPIYIGKAINIKKRLETYFRLNLAVKTKKMISEADKVTYIRVNSELEALLLEAKLIRARQPKYNFIAKDDKHPLYIKITNDKFPIIVTVRKTDNSPALAVFGPFPSSRKIYSVLRMIRKIVPYSDHKLGKKPCIYSHLGLCNPCPNTITGISEREIYLNNIRIIKNILSGKISFVIKDLSKSMKIFSKSEKYEEAALIREKIDNLNYITQKSFSEENFITNPNLTADLRNIETAEIKKLLKKYFNLRVGRGNRFECFDVSHISGSWATASMVTFIKGEPDKSLYRRFRIRQDKTKSDADSLKEIAQRRESNFDKWGKPNLIIVDGGPAQVKAFWDISIQYGIPVVGIEKQFETLVYNQKRVRLPAGPAKNLLVRIRDESHRFAQKYHNLLIYKDLFKLKER